MKLREFLTDSKKLILNEATVIIQGAHLSSNDNSTGLIQNKMKRKTKFIQFKHFLRLTFLLILFPSAQALSQDNSKFIKENENKLNRTRILFGYSSVVHSKIEPELRNFFLNVNHRTNGFDYFTKPFRVKFGFEVGLNGADVLEKNHELILLIPYLKLGPEMSLTKNLFLGAGFGIATSLLSYFAILPYGGINTYYLIPIERDLFLESELGFHSTFLFKNAPYVIYISMGIAIK